MTYCTGETVDNYILREGSIIYVLEGVNDMNNDLISIAKLNELFSKKIDEERKTKLLWILAIVGAVAAVVVAAHYILKMNLKTSSKMTSSMMRMMNTKRKTKTKH